VDVFNGAAGLIDTNTITSNSGGVNVELAGKGVVINHNTLHGGELSLVNSTMAKVTNNSVLNSGIFLFKATFTQLSGNGVIASVGDGIHLDSSSSNTLLNNQVILSKGNGITLTHFSSNNLLVGDQIRFSQGIGLDIENGQGNIVISLYSVVNGEAGVQLLNTQSTTIVDAQIMWNLSNTSISLISAANTTIANSQLADSLSLVIGPPSSNTVPTLLVFNDQLVQSPLISP